MVRPSCRDINLCSIAFALLELPRPGLTLSNALDSAVPAHIPAVFLFMQKYARFMQNLKRSNCRRAAKDVTAVCRLIGTTALTSCLN